MSLNNEENTKLEEYMKERTSLCDKLAFDCQKKMQKDIKRVASQLNNSLETARFLSVLENYIAIILAVNSQKKKRIPK